MRVRTVALAGALLCGAAAARAQQTRYLPAEVEAGGRVYTSTCTGCHGPNGDGVAGVNFSQGKFRRATSDDDLIRIIVRGIPNTPMTPTGMSDGQAATVVAYLRSLGETPKLASEQPGDPARGKSLVEGKGQCLNCHAIGLDGLHAGPALTDIGAQRRAVDLLQSLVDPAADVRAENRTVRVVLKDGRTLSGRFLNQDTFSIQLIDATDKLMSIDKSAVRESTVLTTTPMPSFKGKLTDQELADVVSYLSSLKGRP